MRQRMRRDYRPCLPTLAREMLLPQAPSRDGGDRTRRAHAAMPQPH
jgi:hypothetical protein